jgi:molecular chaperone HtpG
MKEGQKYIYFASGDSVERISKMPQTELLSEEGYEILFFTDDIDEFAIRMLWNYKEKEFKSVSSGDLGIEGKANKAEEAAELDESKEVFDFIKEVLADKVKDVRPSKRMKSHPVCLSAEGELSIEMEKILNAMPNSQEIKAEKVLEINIHHDVFKALKDAFEKDKEKLKIYANVLYSQALLIEGLAINDPIEYTNNICKLIS